MRKYFRSDIDNHWRVSIQFKNTTISFISRNLQNDTQNNFHPSSYYEQINEGNSTEATEENILVKT